MTLPGNKASTPFKTMDIKTALLCSGSRKRKASPQVLKNETKSLKLSVENEEGGNDIKVLEEACEVTITLDQKELDSNLGDCKENKDINAAKARSPVTDCNDNKSPNSVKDELAPHLNKTSCNVSKLASPKSSRDDSDNDDEMLSEKSKNSDDSSCDELNNSKNVSLNTSGISVTGEDDDKGNNSTNSNINECSDKADEKTEKRETKEKAKKKKMTPAEAQKRALEREQKQKERRQEIENKKKERLLEKERRLKEKLLRKEREELERKERERLKLEKKEQEEKGKLQKQKEKEEKLKMKQMILEQKMEEKKKKEEMRQKREEEMRQKREEEQKKADEEKLKKLEKEQKERERNERTKAAFAKFFLKGDANVSTPSPQVTEKEGAFLPFQVFDDMILAPVIPPAAQERFDKKKLDHYLDCQDGKELYIQILKSGSYKDVRHRKKNRKLGASDADVIVIDQNAQAELGLRPKLLQFCENVRPPYWGTWRKKSKNIHPRNPFGQDEIFDYSVDSDDEWDEGGPGESLSGTEQEDESEDDYEVDNEFFVPHGYLSDEEEKKEDDDEEVNDPEKQKALLKLKLQEFEMERKKKTTELKPVILGCYIVNDPAFQDNGLLGFLRNFSVEFLTETPIPTSFTLKNQQSEGSSNMADSPKSGNSNSTSKKKKCLTFPEEAFPQLIRLVHGSIKNRKVLAKEFQTFWLEQCGETQGNQETAELSPNIETDPTKETVSDLRSDSALISRQKLMQTIREIASYGKPPESTYNKCCWWVHDAIREKYGMMDAPIPNQWNRSVSQKESEPQPPVKVNCVSIKEFLSVNTEK